MPIVYQDGIADQLCVNPQCHQWKPLTEFHRRRLLGVPIGDGYKSRCKECLNAQDRAKWANDAECRAKAHAYTEANREHIREIKRAHQKANPENYANADRKYKESHREELGAKARERRNANLERYREIGGQFYERHRDERTAYSRAYSSWHPKTLRSAFEALPRRAGGQGGVPPRKLSHGRFNFGFCSCMPCDDLRPTPPQPLCARCNSTKSSRCTDYCTKHLTD